MKHRLAVPSSAWLLASTLAVALLLAGCGHTSQFAGHSAAVPLPTHWSTTTPAAAPQNISRWWLQFGDAQMAGLIEQALLANTTVQSAQAALRQARAQLGASEASRLPGASASLGGSRSKREPNDASNSFSAGLDVSWEPDLWGRQANAVRASEAGVAAAMATLEGTHVSLAAEVALHYIELRSLQNRWQIAQHNLAIQRENEQISQWRLQAGLATSLDVEQARASTAQTAAQLPALQSSMAQKRHALAVLTGQTPAALNAVLEQAQPLPTPPAQLAMALPADTLRQRPDVRAQEHKVVAALAQLSAQERANFPGLSLRGSLGLSALTLSALGSSGATLSTSIAASLAQTLFDGGLNRARVAEREAALEQARISYRATVLAALQEVEDALVQLQGDQERLVQLQVAQEAASNAQLLASQRYSSGLVDFQTVLDTQRTLLSAQDSVATGQAAIGADYVRLYKALGGGWQPLDVDGQPVAVTGSSKQ